MGYVQTRLNEIEGKIAADPAVLKEARNRRNLVAQTTERVVKGGLRSFRSGSVAHGTVNKPVMDADGGIVLNRRDYPTLGPDGSGEAPNNVVDEICTGIGTDVRKEYPNAKVKQSRRGVLVEFNKPCTNDEDPTVDHIVTLTRKTGEGLWIPDLENNKWTPSHPEKHTELFTSGTQKLRTLRARVTRLAKAWNKQWDEDDRALSSFNVEALAWEYVQDETTSIDEALAGWFAYARDEISKGETKDPACVSEPIRLPLGRDVAVERLAVAADKMKHALANNDADVVQQDMAEVFPHFVTKPSSQKKALAAALRAGTATGSKTGIGVVGSASGLKPVRSFGVHDA
jgi:hypothetical protein